VFDFALHWIAIDLVAVALVGCVPGAVAGLALGAYAWRAHRGIGAAVGAVAGFALSAVVLSLWHGTRLPVGGVALGDCGWLA
jgi:hypothetical protein